MSKREMYEEIVAEVESDKALVEVDSTMTYTDVVQNGSIKLALPEEGVSLKSATSAFTDYGVRDAILIKAMEDEEFAFVLINKIGNTVKSKVEAKTITQDDVEALATAGQVLVMWEQFTTAIVMTVLLDNLIEENKNLREPALATITKRLLDVCHTFPFAETRKHTVRDLSEKSKAGLDNE